MTETPAADIVERLRWSMEPNIAALRNEAAAEIEALRAREAELQALVTASEQERYAKCADLQRKLDEAVKAIHPQACLDLLKVLGVDDAIERFQVAIETGRVYLNGEGYIALTSIRGETD